MNEIRSPNFYFDVLIVGGVLIITDLIGNLANAIFLPWYKPIPAFVTVLAVIFVCTVYAKTNRGLLTFGNIFGYSMKVAALAAVLVAVYSYLSLKYFFPGLREIAMDQVRIELEKKDNLTESGRETALDITKRMFVPLAVFGTIISTMITSVIGALIGYFFTRPFMQGQEE